MRSGRWSRLLGAVLVALVGVLLVEVLAEGWLQALAPGYPTAVKNGTYLVLGVLTVGKVAVDRRWREFATRADLALAALVLVLVLAGLVGGSPAKLIGQALFVYLRGVVVFYALRAAAAPWPPLRRLVWLGAGIVAVNVVVALVQMVVGVPAFRALGWTDLTWAKTDRAQALFTHPNHLGHVLGLAVLGLLAWLVSRPRVPRRWWLVLGVLALALSATQSRESIVAVCVSAGVIWLLARGGRRILLAVLVLVACTGAQVVLRPANFAEWSRRAAGVVDAFRVPSGAEHSRPPTPRPAGSARPAPAAKPKVPAREIRVLYYQQGLRLLARRPVLGYGVGQFGGIVAEQNNPNWNLNPKFGPGGFDRHGFQSKQVDSFWLHLVVEAGLLGLAAYLLWLLTLVRPLLRRRFPSAPADVLAAWAVAAVAFVVQVAFLSESLEDPLLPALLFGIVGLAWSALRWRPAEPEPPSPAQSPSLAAQAG
jgi:O-Antigen ligase